MPSNFERYLRWSKRILQSALLMIDSLTMGDEMMSSTSCVTTTASPKYLRTVLNKYLIYALILAEVRAFQHSSIRIILRTPFSRRIFEMKVSMMMSVTTGSSVRFEEMLSSSKTMKRLSSKSSCLSEFRR